MTDDIDNSDKWFCQKCNASFDAGEPCECSPTSIPENVQAEAERLYTVLFPFTWDLIKRLDSKAFEKSVHIIATALMAQRQAATPEAIEGMVKALEYYAKEYPTVVNVAADALSAYRIAAAPPPPKGDK